MADSLNNEFLFKPSMRYVFFSSLQKESSKNYLNLYDYATEILDSVHGQLNIQNTSPDASKNKIQKALDFLHNAAEYERMKELQFFQNLNTRYPNACKLFNFNKMNNPSDKEYIQFIADINTALKGVKNFKQRLSTEYDRLKRLEEYDKHHNQRALVQKKLGKRKWAEEILNKANDESLTFFKRGGHSFNKYMPDRDPGRRNFLDLFDRSDAMSQITSKVIQAYGGKLFTFNNNCLQPNSAKLAALIKVLSDEAYTLFLSKYKVLNENTVNINLQEIIFGDDFKDFVDDVLNSPYLEESLEDIAHQYNLDFQPDQTDINPNLIENMKQDLITNYNNIKQDLPENIELNDWLNQIGASKGDLDNLYKSVLTVSAQAYYTGEDLNLIELIANKLGVSLGGGKNPTDDIAGGKLIVSYGMKIDEQELEKNLNSIERSMYKEIEGLSQRSIDSFVKNTERLREGRRKQLEAIQNTKELSEKSEEELAQLLNHFNIHTTIKGYSRAGGENFLKEQGFSGASFGSNLIQQLSIIQKMADTGNLDLIDMNFLYFALINAGEQMIGHYLKSQLEDYFSIFVGFLMFNDAELMFEDITSWIQNKTISTVSDIHLYELNGMTFPTSYLLENTWRALTNVQTDINSSQKGNRAVLTTYDKGPIDHNWYETASVARTVTKMEIHFLSGFLDILDQISRAMPQ